MHIEHVASGGGCQDARAARILLNYVMFSESKRSIRSPTCITKTILKRHSERILLIHFFGAGISSLTKRRMLSF